MLVKLDADTGKQAHQGDGTLAGAQFKVEYFDNTDGDTSGGATRTWVFQTDESGEVHLGDKGSGYLVSGDNLYENSAGNYTLPLGTYRFTEVKAPVGYNLPDDSQTMVVKSKGDAEQSDSYVKFGNTKTHDGAAAEDEDVVRGGVKISKQDTQTGTDEQGDATFEGATFAITNTSEHAVYVEGKLYEPGEVVKEIVTDADGIAQTSADCLPYGSYHIDDAGQTVSVVKIGTTLLDSSDNDHVATAGKVKLTDTVGYVGLVPGQEYTVNGTIMVKSTGKALESGGKAVTATVKFTPEKADGSVEVTFEFDASDLKEGTELVVFEDLLTAEGNTVAVHEDISDEGQIVTVDSLDTPETPGTPYDKTGATAPDAGDNALSVLCLAGAALLGAGAATLGCTFARRKKDGGNADETTDGDNDEEAEE